MVGRNSYTPVALDRSPAGHIALAVLKDLPLFPYGDSSPCNCGEELLILAVDQIYSQLPVVQVLADDVMKARVPVVFDHFAGARPALGPSQTGFDVLVDLVRAGKAWIKLSAAYRISDQ